MAVSISSDNNDHLQRKANNCLNSILCVPFADNNVTSRKLSDEDMHQVAHTEGKAGLQSKKTIIVLDLKVANVSVINYQARRIILGFHQPCVFKANNLSKNQVFADYHSRVICRSVSPNFMETPCLCPSEGHRHSAHKVTDRAVTEFCY